MKLAPSALLAIALSASIAQAQRASDPARRHNTAGPAGSTKPTTHPGAKPNDAQLLSHRHYRNAGVQNVRSPAKSSGAQVPARASEKCRDGI